MIDVYTTINIFSLAIYDMDELEFERFRGEIFLSSRSYYKDNTFVLVIRYVHLVLRAHMTGIRV